MIHLSRIHHVALICSDYERSKRFYTDVLGLRIERECYRADRDSWKLDLSLNGVYVLELFSFPEPPERPTRPEAAGLRHLAFAVNDLSVAVDGLARQGVFCEPLRTDPLTGKRFTFLFDPDGQPLELYEASPVPEK